MNVSCKIMSLIAIIILNGCASGPEGSKATHLKNLSCKGPSTAHSGYPARAHNRLLVPNGQSVEFCDEHPAPAIPTIIYCTAVPDPQVGVYWTCGSNEQCGGSTFGTPITRPSASAGKNQTCVPYSNNTGTNQYIHTIIQYVTP
jgi:hypothetical protein